MPTGGRRIRSRSFRKHLKVTGSVAHIPEKMTRLLTAIRSECGSTDGALVTHKRKLSEERIKELKEHRRLDVGTTLPVGTKKGIAQRRRKAAPRG